jgi:hypothetical protein
VGDSVDEIEVAVDIEHYAEELASQPKRARSTAGRRRVRSNSEMVWRKR